MTELMDLVPLHADCLSIEKYHIVTQPIVKTMPTWILNVLYSEWGSSSMWVALRRTERLCDHYFYVCSGLFYHALNKMYHIYELLCRHKLFSCKNLYCFLLNILYWFHSFYGNIHFKTDVRISLWILNLTFSWASTEIALLYTMFL